MKICIDIRPAIWYHNTGIGVYTYEIFNGLLHDKKNEYFFLLPKTKDIYEQECIKKLLNDKCIQKDNIKIIYIENKKNEEEIIKILKENNIDIFHNTQNGIGMPSEKVCKYVVTVHDVIPYAFPKYVSYNYLKTFMLNVPRAIYNSDKIITVSNYSKKDIMKYFKVKEEMIKVIHLASESIYDLYKDESKKVESKIIMKSKYGISKEYILYVGGFNKRKNIKMLIDAYNDIDKKIKEKYNLVIAGKLSEKSNYLKDLVIKLGLEGKVIFPGMIEKQNMPNLYKASSLFVYPSLYEGFGLPVLEAMMCNIPIIASNLTSIPEIAGDALTYIDLSKYVSEERNINDIREKTYKLIVKNLVKNIENLLINNEYIEKQIINQRNKVDLYSFEKVIIETMNAYNEI